MSYQDHLIGPLRQRVSLIVFRHLSLSRRHLLGSQCTHHIGV